MITTNIKTTGIVTIEVINQDGVLEATHTIENMILDAGINALGKLLVEANPAYKIDKIVYGDGAHLTPVTKASTKLNRFIGNIPMKTNIIQHTLERSVSMVFTMDVELGAPTKLMNELGLLCADGSTLFSYIDLSKSDDVIVLEGGKRINIYYKYLWL